MLGICTREREELRWDRMAILTFVLTKVPHPKKKKKKKKKAKKTPPNKKMGLHWMVKFISKVKKKISYSFPAGPISAFALSWEYVSSRESKTIFKNVAID